MKVVQSWLTGQADNGRAPPSSQSQVKKGKKKTGSVTFFQHVQIIKKELQKNVSAPLFSVLYHEIAGKKNRTTLPS